MISLTCIESIEPDDRTAYFGSTTLFDSDFIETVVLSYISWTDKEH